MTLYNWLLTYIGPILGVFLVLLLGLIALAVVLSVPLAPSGSPLSSADDRHGRRQPGGRAECAPARCAPGDDQGGKKLDALARGLERASRSTVQRVGFLRFNPFRDAGGDQSFAVALADQDGNGVVMSSLHSRDVTRVYGKPLAAWESAYPLTDEEQQAIEKAKAKGVELRCVFRRDSRPAPDQIEAIDRARAPPSTAGCAVTAACASTARSKGGPSKPWATC